MIKVDYLQYMEQMDHKDFVIMDAPWNLNDKPPKAVVQLQYELWRDDVTGLISVFNNVKSDLLFVWVINAVIQEMFEALFIYNWTQKDKRLRWRNKNHWCWRKLTKPGTAEFFGTGHWHRNCSEDCYIFARPNVRPIRLNMRSHFQEAKSDKTVKPVNWEVELLTKLKDKGLNNSAYLFSGIDEDKMKRFSEFDIDCVDIAFMGTER